MESPDKNLNPLKILALMLLMAFLIPYAFQPKEWKPPEPRTMKSDPDADPFPILGTEEAQQAWRDRHPIKSWTHPSTW